MKVKVCRQFHFQIGVCSTIREEGREEYCKVMSKYFQREQYTSACMYVLNIMRIFKKYKMIKENLDVGSIKSMIKYFQHV